MVAVADHFLKGSAGELASVDDALAITQQKLRREDDERLADATAITAAVHLTAQQMEVLCRRRAVANLNVVFGAELQEAFDPGARVFRALAFESMRQQQHKSARLIPFRFGGDEELVDDDLCAVDEIAKLASQRTSVSGIGDTVTKLKAHDCVFAEQAVDRFELGLLRHRVFKRQ